MHLTSKIFYSPSENVSYLVLSLAVLILRLGFTPVTFITWIISFAVASAIVKQNLEKNSEPSSSFLFTNYLYLEGAFYSLIIVWAIIAFIFRWSWGWYLFGIAIFFVSTLLPSIIIVIITDPKNCINRMIKAAKAAINYMRQN